MLAKNLKDSQSSKGLAIQSDDHFSETVDKIKASTDDKEQKMLLVELNRYLRKELIARNKGLGPTDKQSEENVKPLLDLLIVFNNCADEVDLL